MIPALEVCVDSVESAVAAQAGGGARLELCDNLLEGGTTPSLGTIRAVRRAVEIDVFVMIRPRGGDFLYDRSEVEAMLADIQVARSEGAQGVVFGALTPEGDVDRELTARLVDAAGPLPVTFHRAFDLVRNAPASLETLIELGVVRVLTSGQAPNVVEGLDNLVALSRRAGDRIGVMPGGGVREPNIARVARATGAAEIHVSGRETRQSAMTFRNDAVKMGMPESDEYARRVTSVERIRGFLAALEEANL